MIALFSVVLVALVRAQEVTLVTHGTMEKLWMLDPLCERWRGPLSLALWTKGVSMIEAMSVSKCESFALSLYDGDDADYPVNKLRNLAISKVNTSHQLVSDLDFLPSIGLRLYLRNLGESWLSRREVALVIPAFQRRGGNCKTVRECRKRVEPLTEKVPANFEALSQCLKAESCIEFQHDVSPGSHSTTDLDSWLTANDLRPIECFKTTRYEPYVVVNKDASPPFDERFTGYGKNKIQHVAHLRKLAFQFVVVPKHFLIHVPHPKSKDKKKWSNDYDRHAYVDRLYDLFVAELDQSHALQAAAFDRPPVHICGRKSSSSRKKRTHRRHKKPSTSIVLDVVDDDTAAIR